MWRKEFARCFKFCLFNTIVLEQLQKLADWKLSPLSNCLKSILFEAYMHFKFVNVCLSLLPQNILHLMYFIPALFITIL